MKKLIAVVLVLAALLSLTACGETAKSADLNALYTTCQEIMPQMIALDADTRLNFLGIQSDDCVQVVTAICTDGLLTDEIWLIEAKDAAALEQLKVLAQNRLDAKADESISYSPEQYAIVQKAQVLTEGNYLALLVSPDVDKLAEAFQAAFN